MKKRVLILASLLLFMILLTSCSSGGNTSSPGQYDRGSGYDNSEEDNGASSPEEYPQEPPQNADVVSDGFISDVASSSKVEEVASQMGSKIIKSGYLAVETLDFAEATSAISRRVQQAGGFIASSNIQGWSRVDARRKPMRNAHYKIRIPSERFEQFMTDVGELGNITRNENWGEDVSAQYFDTEARVKSLNIQEERLLAILSKAEELKDIIELERELSSVRYEIENLTGTLRKYDNLVAYSTLEMEIQEVEEITEIEQKPVTLWDKVVRSFQNSIKNVANIAEGLLLFLIGAIPFLLLLGMILLILFGIAKLLSRKTRKYILDSPPARKDQEQDKGKKE